jgi:putative glutamine amidotransferase
MITGVVQSKLSLPTRLKHRLSIANKIFLTNPSTFTPSPDKIDMIMPKPLIGLTTTRMPNPSGRPAFGINVPYVKSVANAGGLPILIPLELSNDDLDVLLPRLDGVLFTGGYDIDPRQYGNLPHPKVEGVDADRDRVEMHLVHMAIQSGKPFFGICRGCQVINVALGGSLYEDLPEQFPGEVHHANHDQPRNFLAHGVDIPSDSSLAQIMTSNHVRVNSLHHQGVRKLAPQLQATATAPDGLIEAFELPGHPFGLAVQWHPEELQEHEVMRKLFQMFVQSCPVVNSVITEQD